MLRKLCGVEEFKFIVIGATKANRFGDQAATKQRLESLKQKHWKDLIGRGAQVFESHDDQSSASTIIRGALDRYGDYGTRI